MNLDEIEKRLNKIGIFATYKWEHKELDILKTITIFFYFFIVERIDLIESLSLK
jgi:hypothetical protein